jgi:hypothetical protein
MACPTVWFALAVDTCSYRLNLHLSEQYRNVLMESPSRSCSLHTSFFLNVAHMPSRCRITQEAR